jgi:hypothetical protein
LGNFRRPHKTGSVLFNKYFVGITSTLLINDTPPTLLMDTPIRAFLFLTYVPFHRNGIKVKIPLTISTALLRASQYYYLPVTSPTNVADHDSSDSEVRITAVFLRAAKSIYRVKKLSNRYLSKLGTKGVFRLKRPKLT